MSKQTAVNWLIEELGEYFPHEIGGIHLMVEKAKEMEKQQIQHAYVIGAKNQIYGVDLSGLEYYEKTFKD
jgi:hypothetical protein